MDAFEIASTVDAYAQFLEEIVHAQDRARPQLRVLLEDITAAALPTPADVLRQLKLFGSRSLEPGGYCLPSSDFDIVYVVPPRSCVEDAIGKWMVMFF